MFKYHRVPRLFKCVLIYKTDSVDTLKSTKSAEKTKRLLSDNSAKEPIGTKSDPKKRSNKKTDDDDDDIFGIGQTQNDNLNNRRNIKNLSINTSNSQNLEFISEENNIENEKNKDIPAELNPSDLYKLGDNDQYPRKVFIYDGKINYITPVTHLFTTKTRVFKTKPTEAIEFKCKLDNSHIIHCKFGELTNLNHHMFIHQESRLWYNKYKNNNKKDKDSKLTSGQLDIIKLFVSTYQSLSMISNEHFRKLISNTVDIPCLYYFRYDFLETVIEHLHGKITEILDESLIVALVPDIWENNLIHRLGLGAIVTSATFERQLLVIGVEIIEGSSAETVKKTTESIVNKYKFDKHKVRGI